MSSLSFLAFSLVNKRTSALTRFYSNGAVPVAAAKKKKMGKLGPVAEKKEIPVETDVNRLINFVCGSNIYKTGEDVQLKPDTEYPDWLWTLHTEKQSLDELDPNTKQYWRRLRKMGHRRNNQLAKLRKF
ncbi:39S ribosomal protein L54, mitochondrial [Lutzomyia longipalpis]|uniref:39S ribosomal protein L54, mitochondrial n=1 Tax=Lutzomyia longipalpis TaxID=7200 RepID=UPI00248382FC|nr:39S ribosomal protein L54, mitochondrial [Lutzomyia longipalpis]